MINPLSYIRARFKKLHPDNHAIARGMVWVILFVFLGKLAGAAKEMAIAYRYGISEEVDAYLFVFNLLSWPLSVWFSVLTVVLVPLAARIRIEMREDLPRFRSELLGLTFLIGIGLLLLAWFGLPMLLRSQWIGLPSTSVVIASNMVSVLTLVAPLSVLISLFSAWMMSAGRHANTLLESIPALLLLVAILVFPSSGAGPLIWGTVAGFVFHLFCLVVPLVRCGDIEAPCFTRESTQWPAFWQGFGITLVGQALMSFIGVIDQLFASHLSTGAIATLSYANRLLALIMGLGATAVARATLPVFSKAHAQGEEQFHLHNIAAHWVRVLFVCGVVAAITGWWIAPTGVKLLFERGAFTAQHTKAVTEVLRYGLIQIPFYFAGLVLVSLMASQRKYKLIAISAILNLFVKIIANFVFIPLLGLNGIVTATATMYIGSFIVLYWFVNFLEKPINLH